MWAASEKALMVGAAMTDGVGHAATDEALMARVQGGCQRSFEVLMRRHYSRVVNFAARMTGDPDLGADVAQYAFAVVHSQRSRFRTSRRFEPWLYTIVRRQCHKIAHRQARGGLADSSSADASADPVGEVEKRAVLAALRQALVRLPERERSAVVMFHYLQWPYDEIAEALGCSAGAARTAACRGRARLRSLLSDFEEALE